MEDKRQEDVDMLSILTNIKKGAIALLRSIVWLFRFSYKKFFTLLIFILICTGLSLGIYAITKPYYTSHFSISHIRFENDYCREMISGLNSYIIGSKDRTELARELSIPVADAKNIKSIKYFPLNEHIAERYADSAFVLLPFKVEVQVYDNGILETLQNGIMNYLESNDYATRRKSIEKQSLDSAEKKIREEILDNDSLKKIVNQGIVPRGTGNGIVFGEPVDPVAVYKRGMELHEKQLLLNKKRQLNNSFELLVGVTRSSEPTNSGLFFYILTGIIVGYIVGLLWLVNRRFNGASQ